MDIQSLLEMFKKQNKTKSCGKAKADREVEKLCSVKKGKLQVCPDGAVWALGKLEVGPPM